MRPTLLPTHIRRPLALFAAGVAVCLTVVAAPKTGAAQMSSDVSDKAKRHYKRGVALYDKEQYTRAAAELRKAYSLAPSPLLLYNVAMAEWRSGDVESALTTCYRVLEDGLKGKMQPTLQGRVRGLERILSARKRADALEPAPTTPPSRPTAADTKRGMGAAGWLAIATGSAGALSLFGALSINRQIASDVGTFENAARRGDAAAYRRQLDDLQQRQLVGRILLGSGATLMATATGLFIAELASTPDGSPRTSRLQLPPIRVSVTPAEGGLIGTISLRPH